MLNATTISPSALPRSMHAHGLQRLDHRRGAFLLANRLLLLGLVGASRMVTLHPAKHTPHTTIQDDVALDRNLTDAGLAT